tara:strand:- start:1628 stop:2047 length:420 start_codon:yes stop_codon:yes gene_type:complete
MQNLADLTNQQINISKEFISKALDGISNSFSKEQKNDMTRKASKVRIDTMLSFSKSGSLNKRMKLGEWENKLTKEQTAELREDFNLMYDNLDNNIPPIVAYHRIMENLKFADIIHATEIEKRMTQLLSTYDFHDFVRSF